MASSTSLPQGDIMEKSIYDIIHASAHAKLRPKPSATHVEALIECKDRPNPQSQSHEIQKYETELKERLHAIATLRDLVVQQKKTITALRKKHIDYRKTMLRMRKIRGQGSLDDIHEELSATMDDSNESEDDEDNLYCTEQQEKFEQHTVSFRTSFEQPDEDMMSAITCESGESFIFHDAISDMGEECREAIAAIQEQASQIDTVIALDRLDTAKTDLHEVSKKLERSSSEVDRLNDQVKDLEGRLASVELERDLLKAEATRTKEDLRACVRYMANLHIASSRGQTFSDEEPRPHKNDTCQENSCQSSVQVDKNNEVRQRPAISDTKLLKEIGESHDFQLELAEGWASSPTSKTEDASDVGTVEPTDGNMSQSPLLPPTYARSANAFEAPARATEARNLGLCFWRQRSRENVDNGPAFMRMDDESTYRAPSTKRRFGHSRKKHGSTLSIDKNRRRINSSLQSKVQDLNSRLEKATQDADELRQRLSSTTRYYDNVVHSLQQSVGALRSDQSEFPSDAYTSDMIGQLSLLDHEKRVTLEKLRSTDATIAQLQTEKAEVLRSSESPPLQRAK